MQISHTVKLEIERSAEAVYDFVTAVETPTKVFSGYGPIPAVIETTVVGGGPLLEGSICRTRNSDGSMMNRTISVLERPRRHQYVVDGDGFRPLFRMMVRRGHGTWLFEPRGDASHLLSTYSFEPRRVFWWIPVFFLIRIFFAPAMARCILATKRELERAAAKISPRAS